eukprot:2352207-Pyramimonas_sp.AAC.2
MPPRTKLSRSEAASRSMSVSGKVCKSATRRRRLAAREVQLRANNPEHLQNECRRDVWRDQQISSGVVVPPHSQGMA